MALFSKKSRKPSVTVPPPEGEHTPAMCAECPLYQTNTCSLLDAAERSDQKGALGMEPGLHSAIGMYLDPGEYRWCSCGCSQEQPFCDGSHKITDCLPVKFKIGAGTQVKLCGCKRTRTPPFCDGSHDNCSS